MAYTAVDSTVLLFLSTDHLPFLLTFGVWTVQPTMQIQLRNFVFMLVAASAIALAESVVATEGEATPSPLLTWPLPPLPWRGRPHPPPWCVYPPPLCTHRRRSQRPTRPWRHVWLRELQRATLCVPTQLPGTAPTSRWGTVSRPWRSGWPLRASTVGYG